MPRFALPPRVWLAVLALAALGFLARLALVPASDGVDFDGPGYMQAAERLDEVAAGRMRSFVGERAPFVYPIGLPLLLRATSVLGASTRDAGVLLSLLAGTALVPLGFLLARRIAGDAAGLLAASWIAVDPELVDRSHTLQSESVFAALLWGGLLPLLDETLSRRRAIAGAVLLVVASSVRSIGLPVGLIAAVALARRGERRIAAGLVLGLLLVGGVQRTIEARNGAQAYWRSLAKLSLWEEGEYPEYFDLDEPGTTHRVALDPRGPLEVAREKPEVAARIFTASTAAAALALLPFVVAAPFALGRRSLVVLAAILVGAVVPLLLLQHHRTMPRMILPFRPGLLALAAAGVATVGARLRLGLSPGAAATLAVLAGLGTFAATSPPALGGLARLGAPGTPRAEADAIAARIAALVARDEPILRGPGGQRTLIALAGRYDVYAPSPATPPARFRAFCARNGIRFVLHDGSVPLGRFLAPARLSTTDLGGGQLLTRIED